MWPRYPPVASLHSRCAKTVATSPHANGRRGNGYGPSRNAPPTITAASRAHADAASTTVEIEIPGIALTRYGVAFPTVRAPTTVPTASPRRERNHVAAIFMAGGYTPARKNPVAKRV